VEFLENSMWKSQIIYIRVESMYTGPELTTMNIIIELQWRLGKKHRNWEKLGIFGIFEKY
jgi:hypothetical protein